MTSPLVPARLVALVPTTSGCGIFVGTDAKTFLIQVDPQLGQIIDWYRQGVAHPRPLTHDLFAALLQGVGGVIQRAVITETRDEVFFAQLRIACEDALERKLLIDLDCRPSDAMALCSLSGAPLFVTRRLLDQVEDMGQLLDELGQLQIQTLFEGDEDEDEEEGEDETDEGGLFGSDEDDEEEEEDGDSGDDPPFGPPRR